MLTHGIPPDHRSGVHLFKLPHDIGSVPSLSGRAGAYRWRSLPRVRRHRASGPQGSSSNRCCLCITIDQLMCASLFPHPLTIQYTVYTIIYYYILLYTIIASIGDEGMYYCVLYGQCTENCTRITWDAEQSTVFDRGLVI